MKQRRVAHTLQATSLVNEAYLRLIDVASELDEDPSHHLRRQSQKVRAILELDEGGRQRLTSAVSASRFGGDVTRPASLSSLFYLAGKLTGGGKANS